MTEVKVKRTELHLPTPDDPERKVYQIEYQVGELPPRFLFLPVKGWTKVAEAAAIKADIKTRTEAPEETIEL